MLQLKILHVTVKIKDPTCHSSDLAQSNKKKNISHEDMGSKFLLLNMRMYVDFYRSDPK